MLEGHVVHSEDRLLQCTQLHRELILLQSVVTINSHGHLSILLSSVLQQNIHSQVLRTEKASYPTETE